MSTCLPGFKGEFLWEFDIAQRQLLTLADAFPTELCMASGRNRPIGERGSGPCCSWQPYTSWNCGVEAAPDLYGELEGEIVPCMMAMIKKNDALEKTITGKTAIIELMKRSLDAVAECIYGCSRS